MRVRTSFGCGRSGARYQNTSHASSGGASSSTENSWRCMRCRLCRDELLDRLREAVLPGPVLLEVADALRHADLQRPQRHQDPPEQYGAAVREQVCQELPALAER